MRINKKQKLKYKRLLNRLSKTKSLRHMSKLITEYSSDNNNYINTTRTTSNYGDCNGDGNVDILDIVTLVNFIMGDSETINQSGDFCMNNCIVSYNANDNSLYHSGGSVPNITSILAIMNFIQAEDTEDYPVEGGDEISEDVELVVSDEELIQRVYGYQNPNMLSQTIDDHYTDDGVYVPYNDGFYYTQNLVIDGSFNPVEEGYSDYTPPFPNSVLITAPHAQRVFRPTVWTIDGNPMSNLDNCNSLSDTSCHKGADTCTGAMAKALSDITGAPYMTIRGKQNDANYYDYIGYDLDGYHASQNLNTGNIADPNYGIYDNDGLQTPTYAVDNLHPLKQQISNYLSNNPNIKLVIDLHGASATTNHWDVDIGLLGNNGIDGTMDITQVDIGNNTIPYDLLNIMVNTFYDYEIGLCPYDCEAGTLSDCEKYSLHCPPGVTGHGPISFNDFSGANQYTITKFVNEYFGEEVYAIQLETSAIYRCLGSSDVNDVLKYMRSLQDIIHKANIYFNENV